MDVEKTIQKRKSVRRFKDKKPDWREIIKAIDSMRYAPMAGNIFTLRAIMVQDLDKIQKLADAAQQGFISQAKCVVVVCTKKDRCVKSYGKDGEKYVKQQAGAAIQNFLLSLEEMGLSSCWIGAFVDNQVKRILNIPNDIDIEAMFPVGYELGKTIKKAKQDIDYMLYYDKWKNKKMIPPKKVEAL